MGKGWKNPIKAEQAAKKGAIFTKVAREISVAAKLGGPDPEGNSRLKLAIAAAKEVSCPKDTIERAIKKGAGLLEDGTAIDEITYEGLGPFGVGIIVECQTDNRNRTVGELRNIFKRHGGNLGETNSAAWMFERVSIVEAHKTSVSDPDEDAIEVGANNVVKVDGKEANTYEFVGGPSDLESMRTGLVSRGWTITTAELSYLPKNKTDLSQEQMKELEELLNELDGFDDTHRIHATI